MIAKYNRENNRSGFPSVPLCHSYPCSIERSERDVYMESYKRPKSKTSCYYLNTIIRKIVFY